jgi:hypothetical protein
MVLITNENKWSQLTPQLTRVERVIVKTNIPMEPFNGNVVPSWNLYDFPFYEYTSKCARIGMSWMWHMDESILSENICVFRRIQDWCR